ncbi:hypothetical protein GCM10012284_64160 [Mangrovihabitans endophyticus]|uniref:Uncharacterized protein n=1 Tax=Mangrovihabitans endophyticus TaxID=1751298 RepID=A0A8J3FS01_9ACTN|nr:hypothetical protein GCM10012284_64160 [Mangrovihabitans endophyticus]
MFRRTHRTDRGEVLLLVGDLGIDKTVSHREAHPAGFPRARTAVPPTQNISACSRTGPGLGRGV